jgi:phosphopantothenoylcysteine decarboxylase / phosphopantothenate---cysteine ligase
MLSGKRILLIIGGGIAAYKALYLIRLLKGAGAAVTPVLTRAGAEFVTPLSVAALAGERVHDALFDLTDEAEMGHIELSRVADLIVVAPATADLLAKLATGRADDLASTLLLATDTPVLVAPAMNVRMWTHAATQRNLAVLRGDGVRFVGPDEGEMACGEFGPGRMAEPEVIFTAIQDALSDGPLTGRHVLVTSGPTHEPIDPVRYIANRSSGAQGTALATALRDLGARVTFVTGPASVPPPDGVAVVRVDTARRCGGVCRGGGGLAGGQCRRAEDEERRFGQAAGAEIRREYGYSGHCRQGAEPARAGGGLCRRDAGCCGTCHRQTPAQGLRLDRGQ